MLTLLFGLFAFFWAAVAATVGITVVVALVIPIVLLAVIFRIGLIFIKMAAAVVLLALFSVCLF